MLNMLKEFWTLKLPLYGWTIHVVSLNLLAHPYLESINKLSCKKHSATPTQAYNYLFLSVAKKEQLAKTQANSSQYSSYTTWMRIRKQIPRKPAIQWHLYRQLLLFVFFFYCMHAYKLLCTAYLIAIMSDSCIVWSSLVLYSIAKGIY